MITSNTCVSDECALLAPLAHGQRRTLDYQKLYNVTKGLIRDLNKIIDENYYTLEEARNSNMRHRPVGIGVQGLADVFMGLPFESDIKTTDTNEKKSVKI